MSDRLLLDPDKTGTYIEIEKRLVAGIRDKRIQMVVFASNGFRRTLRVISLADTDTKLERTARLARVVMAKALACCIQNRRVVGDNLNGIAKWIEKAMKRQLHTAKKRFLW